MVRLVALTGTPGVGKSTVGRILSKYIPWVEFHQLSDVSRSRRTAPARDPDPLPRLTWLLRRAVTQAGPKLVISGHRSHELPVQMAIVLRAHPRELMRRLRQSRHGSERERWDNATVEAISAISFEARRRRIPVVDIDTTHRSPSDIAEEVLRVIRRDELSSNRAIDWLSDPRVTEGLLGEPS